jgi:uncharacterized protein involved in exopolysaccharide biosynthesis
MKNFREQERCVGDSPELLLGQEQLLYDLQFKSTAMIQLKKQHELAKIEEIKNIPIVNILDPARAPINKDKPKRTTNTAIQFLLALVGTLGYYAVRSVYGEKLRRLPVLFRCL